MGGALKRSHVWLVRPPRVRLPALHGVLREVLHVRRFAIEGRSVGVVRRWTGRAVVLAWVDVVAAVVVPVSARACIADADGVSDGFGQEGESVRKHNGATRCQGSRQEPKSHSSFQPFNGTGRQSQACGTHE